MRNHEFIRDFNGDCLACPLPASHPVHRVEKPAEEALPVTPYAGTSGWSGSQTSRERAETEDRSGVTSERQRTVLRLLGMAGIVGLTWKELAEVEEWHHGQASGALSNLHKDGHIARLAEDRRERCAVYVLPENVLDRPTAEHGRNAADPDVVKRDRFRVIHPTRREVVAGPTWDEDEATTIAGRHLTVQRQTVIETPWEDA